MALREGGVVVVDVAEITAPSPRLGAPEADLLGRGGVVLDEQHVLDGPVAAELDPDDARAHVEDPDQLRAHAEPSSAAACGWLAGEAFPATELLKPEALLQREGLAVHLLAQFVELLPFLGGDCRSDGLAALWLGLGHRPVKPSRSPGNPHLVQGLGLSLALQ